MIKSSFWRKVALVFTAVAMSLVLTACGGPNEDKAGKFALDITKAMFAGNVQPMIDNMDYSKLDPAQEAVARQAAAGKLKELMDLNQMLVAQRGGVKDITVSKVTKEENTQIYNVVMKVTFNNGESQDSKTRVRWDEKLEKFVIMSK